MKKNNQKFGEWLRKIAEKNELTKSSIAKEAGLSLTAISHYMAGRNQAKPENEEKIRAAIAILTPQEEVAFGQWLRDTRIKKNISVQELSEKSKISTPALYNIENGKTQNPNLKTRQKIEAALGEGADIPVEEKENDIQNLGSLEGFDPYEINLIPTSPGVYVLYDISERPIYVGRSKNINKRIKQHSNSFWFKRPIISTGSYIVIKDDVLRNQIEEILIKFLKSNAVINKVYVDRDLEDSL